MTPPIIDLSDRTNMFYWQTNRKISAQQDKEIFLSRHARFNEEGLRRAAVAGMKKAGFSGDDASVRAVEPIIANGLINTVVPIVLKSGRNIVLRMHPPEVKNGYFWVESLASKIVQLAGVPTYMCLVVDDTRASVPFDYMIMTREPGKPVQDLWPLPPDLEEHFVTQTGRYAARIHSIEPDGFGFFRNDAAKKDGQLLGQYTSLQEHMYAGMEEDLSYLEDSKTITVSQRKIIEGVFAKHTDLFSTKKSVLIHNDIADWNTLTDGTNITAIMDWDECVGGDPIMELSAYSLFFGEPRMSWFIRGYEEVKKLGDWKEKFELFKLRYLVSKLHLRKKRSTVDSSDQITRNLVRGLEAMQEVFAYFRVS
ncbi:MAG: aminoglycoside phosphotransferase family protein [Patescibacteria group bacterium]